jgi:hypothetical protein
MYINNIFASKNLKNEYNVYSGSLQTEYKYMEAQNISTSAISM